MPEVKITQHRDGHTQEHTFHLPYDSKGERLAGRLTRMLHKHVKAGREASGPPVEAKAKRKVRGRKIRSAR